MSYSSAPIGIFDSGVGGLSIARAIRALLPGEMIHYVADQQYNPYGEQEKSTIEGRSMKVVEFLMQQGCKSIVVACNTATVNAVDRLRDRYDVPIVGVEPGIKPAAERTRTGVVGVLATRQTLASQSYNGLKKRVASDVCLLERACPDFVSLVERGHLCGDDTREAVERYVGPLLDAGVDQIVLGCTHFSFLAPEISKFCGDGVEMIDTASPVANELLRRINDDVAENPAQMPGDLCCWRSKVSALDDSVIRELWGQEISVETILL